MMRGGNDQGLARLPGFRRVPRTGVIYVMTEAASRGFDDDRESWANLGQGAPETSELPGGPPRLRTMSFTDVDHEYAPIAGLPALRDAVAELYNERYRGGKRSKYSRDNVAISAGGRLALTRLMATVGHTNVGHFLPDYTAYEELLGSFGTFVSVPILTDPERGYALDVDGLRREILGRGFSAILLSNPCNPTGRVIAGESLASWVETARELSCSLIFDEFYSHYVYGGRRRTVSAAAFVDDVDRDPVILFDGLTKNWRYPGFRVAWTLGPAPVIAALSSAGSFIDGGAPRPMQLAALDLVEPALADREADAVQAAFSKKRAAMLEGLRSLGIRVAPPPGGGFYCWGDLSALPPHCNTGMRLFRAGLERRLIVVPGVFFDINPGRRRPDRASRFGSYARFSFGPPLQEVELGLHRLEELVRGG